MAFGDRLALMMTSVKARLGVSVTIRRRQVGSLDFTTMAETSVITGSTTVTAVRNRTTMQPALVGKGRTITEVYTIDVADLAFTPDIDDTLIRAGLELSIKRVETICSGAALQISAEGTINE